MKKSKSIYLALLAILFSVNIIAQHNVGFGTGFNLASMRTNLTGDLAEYAGMSHEIFGTVGLLYRAELDENWAISTGLNYARRGAESKLNQDLKLFDKTFNVGVRLTHKMDYLEVPVLFEYRIKDSKSVSPYLFAGANFGYELNYNMLFKSHIIIDINLYDYNVDLTSNRFNRFDIAGVVGAGVYVPLGVGNLNFDIRYLHGFTDIVKNTVVDLGLQHRNVRIGAAYYYPLSKSVVGK